MAVYNFIYVTYDPPVQCAKYQIISKSVETISQDIESPIVSNFLNPAGANLD